MTLYLGLLPGCFADDFDLEITRFLKLSNSVQPSLDMMDNMLLTMSPNMIEQISRKLADSGKVVAKEEVVELVRRYRENVVVRFGAELEPLLGTELRKHFTLSEIISINELMEMPAFQAYAEKLPVIAESARKAGASLGEKIGTEVMLELIAKNPAFQ